MASFIRFFIFRLFLFFLPVAVLFIFPFWVLAVSGELVPVERIVDIQQASREPVLVGLAYSNPEKYFKLRTLIVRHPKVVVFGNSHVMAMRAESFGGEDFYNAAVGGSRLPDFKNFVESIPKGLEPRVLIAGLDPFFAKPDFEWAQQGEDRFEPEQGLMGAVRILGSSWRKVYDDFFQHKFSAAMLAKKGDTGTTIGLEARVRGNGFLKDGSHLSSKKPVPFSGQAPDYSYLKNGESFDGEGLRYLQDFLEVCRRRGIYVIGILPPVRASVFGQLRSSGYRYWEDLEGELRPLFLERGHSLYDFSVPEFYGGNDGEFIDDFHASEAAYRRIAERLFTSEKALRA